MARPVVIAGNWKMNGTIPETESLIGALLNGLPTGGSCEVVVCPPFPSLVAARAAIGSGAIRLGAQDCSEHESGAYTGEVSTAMLLTVPVSHVIIGHSERRTLFQETDDRVNLKVKRALGAGLTPIVCIGETESEREANATEAVLERQIRVGLADLDGDELARLVVAYEPVWAIGTGKTATPEMAQEAHAFVRKQLDSLHPGVGDRIPILYGGSVKADNAAGLLSERDIDGALVGGASLKPADFLAIIAAGSGTLQGA